MAKAKKNNPVPAPKIIEPQKSIPQGKLIFFDKKVKIFIYTNVVLLMLLSMLKIHGCSVSIWNTLFGINEKANPALVYGEPRGIRQDDWMVVMPFFLSQYNLGNPTQNPSIGGGSPALLMGLPFDDVIPFFRPVIWGFYLLDVERGYAFWWNFKYFGAIVGFFLFLMLLTENNFWLSVFGSVWLYLSSGMQWWSFGLALYVLNFSMIFISLIYVLFSEKKWIILLNSFLLLFFSYSFVDMLYPPWQVPMVYILLIAIGAFIFKNYDKKIIFSNYLVKILGLLGVLLILIALGIHFYVMAKDTVELMTNTAYPGKRQILSGTLDKTKLLGEYFGIFMTETKFPQKWLNICEASGFLLFFPVIFYRVIRNLITRQKNDIFVILLSALILFFLAWMLLPSPQFIGKITLMQSVPAYRLLVIFGFANIILTILYLNYYKAGETRINPKEIIYVIAVIAFMIILITGINKGVDNFFTKTQVVWVIIIFSVLYIILDSGYFKYRNLTFSICILLFLLPNIRIHPVSKGLKPIMNNPFIVAAGKIEKQDPGKRWIVVGQSLIANLLMSRGINVFNGVKFLPDIPSLRVLDPEKKSDFVYNRSGHIVVNSYIPGNDSVVFRLNENAVVNDNYSIFLDPCSPKLRKIGVKYVVFTYEPQPAEIRCMTRVSSEVLPIFAINE